MLRRNLYVYCGKAFQHRGEIRNIAVIAHVDHGKTTLVDAMLRHSGTVQDARNRVMDSKDQEKERGITILAKHTAILVGDNNRINIVDTPGHLDFGGEVERALQMVEGFLLLVDAHEGVKPGTRYVLRKALALRLTPVIVVNKIDMDEADITKAEDQVTDLFLETVQDADQLNLTFVYGSGRDGYMNTTPKKGGDMKPLFETILKTIPPPKQVEGSPLRLLVGNVDEAKDGSRIAIGRIFSGSVAEKQLVKVALENVTETAMVKRLQLYRGVDRVNAPTASFGDIAIVHLQEAKDKSVPLRIGATICEENRVEPWPYVKPDEPTFSLVIREMTASWKGKEVADHHKSRFSNIRERLFKEALNNVALQVYDYKEAGCAAMKMLGRGLLHLSVIVEDLRREDYEFELQAPETVTRLIDGVPHEPFEKLTLEYKQEHTNAITQLLTSRHADIGETTNTPGDRLLTEVHMAARLMGDINLRFLRITSGDGVMTHEFAGYRPLMTSIETARTAAALVSADSGTTTDYALSQNKEHGTYFVNVGDEVYFGQVVGEATKLRGQDMPINVTKAKELTNFRANAADAAKRTQSGFRHADKDLEDALTWVTSDELVTVTPKTVRIRKVYFDGKTTRPKKAI